MSRADESGRKLRETLDAIPGATEAFRNVLRDPKTKEELAAGVQTMLNFPARVKVVGWLVAVAEIEDRDTRMTVAKTLQEAGKRAKPKGAAGAAAKE